LVNESLLFFLIAFLSGIASPAWQKSIPLAEASSVRFVIRNFGFNTGGKIGAIKGSLYFDKNNLAKSYFDITAGVATIDTDNAKRDKHLLSADYFDVANYPTIRMMGKPVLNKNGNLLFNGTLSIKNTSRPLSFPFTVKTLASGSYFEATFTINRLSYQVGKKSAVLSDDVKVTIKVLAQ
jgi:polyisoprenoid-binding protein YceI